MKKLKRNDLKKIEGGATQIISCDINMMCPRGLCCSTGDICRDPRKYMCI
ncbi:MULTISPECIES: hypothetical protein [Chryseobacterium]|nr:MULTISPECIES: hypothetical protein [Chryseobacterium]VFA43450.1 Uncharacterised protein [Chryseobacterium indologenes]